MKKTWILALMVLLLAGAFASCDRAPARDPNTLVVWCWDPNFNILAMNEAGRIFQRDNPDFVLDVVETPWDELQTSLITAFAAGTTAHLPDIILMQDNAMQMFLTVFPGYFLPLTNRIDMRQFAEYKVDFGLMDGHHFSVPFDNGVTATFLRTDIIAQAGLTVADFTNITWERFMELGIMVREATGMPLISTVANEVDTIAFMLQSAGTWFFDEQGNTFIQGNPTLRRAVELYYQMVQAGVILEVVDWNAYVTTINNGSVAATVAGCWIIGSITSQPAQHGLWAMTNIPRFGTIPSVNYSSWGGSSWMVLSSSPNADLAVEFLNRTFAGSVELYETILPASGAIATWLPAANAPAYAAPHPFFGGQAVFQELIAFAANVPRVRYGVFNYEARDAVGRAVAEIIMGSSIDSALAAAHSHVDFLIRQ